MSGARIIKTIHELSETERTLYHQRGVRDFQLKVAVADMDAYWRFSCEQTGTGRKYRSRAEHFCHGGGLQADASVDRLG